MLNCAIRVVALVVLPIVAFAVGFVGLKTENVAWLVSAGLTLVLSLGVWFFWPDTPRIRINQPHINLPDTTIRPPR